MAMNIEAASTLYLVSANKNVFIAIVCSEKLYCVEHELN